MKYYDSGKAVKYDELIGGTEVRPWAVNVSLGSGVEIERGELLERGSNGIYTPVESVHGDSSYAIAMEDVSGSSDRVTTVYETGIFNREKIITGSAVDLDDIEHILKNQGIFLTNSMEV